MQGPLTVCAIPCRFEANGAGGYLVNDGKDRPLPFRLVGPGPHALEYQSNASLRATGRGLIIGGSVGMGVGLLLGVAGFLTLPFTLTSPDGAPVMAGLWISGATSLVVGLGVAIGGATIVGRAPTLRGSGVEVGLGAGGVRMAW